ncbi:MAG TPA: 3-dehydroquinate synthase [Tepidisphaeraceae bacterium]
MPAALDVAFSVPFTHRIRFTGDVLGADDCVLLDVLVAAGRARVLAVVDSGVDAATGAAARVRDLVQRHGDAVELVDVCLLTGGEAIKNDSRSLLGVLERMDSGGLDRRSYVLAVGGGAFLDAVGLAVALAHRGIRLVRLPTTVMGQADSGIGVKNAVNFFGKKNWLGSFAVPWAVINDRTLLASLPDREYRCGFSEAVKVSLLKDAAFFDQLCHNAPALARHDNAASEAAIRRSAYWHLMHITRGGDPFEAQEARPLDFGHWAAHQIEAMTDFSVRHGEAVAIGLAIDCTYATLRHGLPAAQTARVLKCLRDLGLTLSHPCLESIDTLLGGIEQFRQHLGGRLTLTMLQDVARPIDVHEIDLPAMRQAIETIRNA